MQQVGVQKFFHSTRDIVPPPSKPWHHPRCQVNEDNLERKLKSEHLKIMLIPQLKHNLGRAVAFRYISLTSVKLLMNNFSQNHFPLS
jgi:hypothetical protein